MDKLDEKQCAFVLRIAPSFKDAMDEALKNNEIIIGWAEAEGLLDRQLEWYAFREIIHQKYHSEEQKYYGSGNAAGHMWRFIREMKEGDLVVAPHGDGFFVGQITGEAIYDKARVADDRAYRRPVTWLNPETPILRRFARAALQSRMKTYGTCANATDLINEITEVLRIAERGDTPTFAGDLRTELVQVTLKEIRKGRIENYGFEHLVKSILEGLGAHDVQIVPRSKDQGGDILARFRLAGTFEITLAVQAKHHFDPNTPTGIYAVEQLAQGMQAENAHLGLVVTAGTLSPESFKRAEKFFTEDHLQIELVDGEQLASLIVDHGLTGALTAVN